MNLFDHSNRDRNDGTRRIYALYEIAHTSVDFSAAACFLIGSVLFLWPAYETAAIWLFIIGSVFFMAKPTLRLLRELHLYRMGKLDTLAKRTD
ncbi:YrhK family protein [Puniceibacterium sediminis]|uniref:YrhK-like protein n=1 Tax=Puniceibacterium sediminis TaxID=1608407 RepID=A0A238URU8_9RHOB|nr:YrhK family protein [Puniceibacterium sediminis]SNR24870.1 YrhK-like protein [Puniceibacterium sediminis]